MGFRYDIGFLRAIAVIIVMLFHYKIFGFSGGFIGVDVFFVISGFLMTQIVLSDFRKGSFSLLEFYKRRIKRIIPALQVLLIFVLIVSAILFLQTDLRLNAKYTFFADLFASNIYFWKYQDYFASGNNILLHTWTLGVEWQFYMIYPLILLLLRGLYLKNAKLFWIILTLICLASLTTMLVIGGSKTNFIFYMLPSRYWELSIGGLAYGIGLTIKPSKTLQKVLVIIGIITILIATYFISEKNLWPSIYTIIPVFATVMILALNVDFGFFKNKIAQFFGNISYSLYLWHWPWLVLFQYFRFNEPIHIAIIIILSIICAYFSYRFIETKKKVATVKASLISVAIVGIISALLFIKPHIARPISIYQSKKLEIGDFAYKYLLKEKNKQFNSCGCFVTNDQTIKDFKTDTCLSLSSTKPNILLIGDSHSAEFSYAFRQMKAYNIVEASVGNTLPIINSKGKPGLIELTHKIFNEYIPQNKDKIDLIVVSAHWLALDNPNINYTKKQLLEGIQNTNKFFDENKIPYLYIGQTVEYDYEYVKFLTLQAMGRFKNEAECINKEGEEMNKDLVKIIPADNYINVYQSPLITHYDTANLQPYMFDKNHLTMYGTEQMMNKIIIPRIEAKLKQ